MDPISFFIVLGLTGLVCIGTSSCGIVLPPGPNASKEEIARYRFKKERAIAMEKHCVASMKLARERTQLILEGKTR